jgi:hypothetical protein
METSNTMNKDKVNLEEAKAEINRLLKVYRIKKDDLEWADDDWEVGEIQEELDGYARRIRVLKSKVREYEKLVKA